MTHQTSMSFISRSSISLPRSLQPLKRLILALLTLLLAWPALADEADDATRVRTIEQTFLAHGVEKVEIDVTLASLAVVGVDGSRKADVEVILSCRRKDDAKCLRRAERIRLAPRLNAKKMALRVKGTSRGQAGGIEAHMKIRIPSHVALEIDMAGGDVLVQDMLSHVEIDSGGGNIEYFGQQDKIASFKVDVGFGKGSLWLRDSKVDASGWPRSIDWKGSGQAKIEFDLGGGTVKARLD